MKIKLKYLLFTLLIVIAALSACSKNVESNGSQQASTVPQNFAQNAADVYGEVKSLSGSKVTIALLEMPQRRQMTDEQRQQMQQQRQNQQGINGTTQPAASGGNQPPVNGQNSTAARPNGNRQRRGQVFGQNFSKNYTGETITLTIPSEVSIKITERGNQGVQEKEIKVSEIKTGDIIQAWYKADSQSKEIDSIRISEPVSAPASSNANANTSQTSSMAAN